MLLTKLLFGSKDKKTKSLNLYLVILLFSSKNKKTKSLNLYLVIINMT